MPRKPRPPRPSGRGVAQARPPVRRAPGTGTIVFTRGRYLPRLPNSLGRKPLTPCATYDDAAALLDTTIARLRSRHILPADHGETWATLARKWIATRSDGPGLRRSYGQAVDRVSREQWATMPLDTVRRRDILAWLDDRFRTRRYRKRTTELDLATARQVYLYGLDREIVTLDPTVRVRIPAGWSDDDVWTWLTLDELRAIMTCDAVSLQDKAIVAFFVGTGLRKSEWLSLRLEHVRADGIAVQYGTEYRGKPGPTKGRKARVIPILPLTARAWSVWLSCMPKHCQRNPRALAFPGPMGGRFKTWVEDTFYDVLTASGITRDVRPHDLRHTAGAALVSGYWGRRWPLVEVRDFLGHSSVSQTERYAHLADGHLEHAALESLDPIGHALVELDHTRSLEPTDQDVRKLPASKSSLGTVRAEGVEIVGVSETARSRAIGHAPTWLRYAAEGLRAKSAT